MTRLKRGDYVRVRPLDGRFSDWHEGCVALAADGNPSSVMVLGAAFRVEKGGVFVGGLPLIIDYGAGTATGLGGELYEMEVRGEP